jgi:predicted CXXCH cytochrome family protein
MKKFVILAVAVIMVIGLSSVSMAAGRAAGLGIAQSVHDFSTAVWNSGGEICIVCHTPHAAANTDGLLWNRTASTATYQMYNDTLLGNLLDGQVDDQPTGISKLCLSCHDGTVALDAFGGGPTTSTSGTVTGQFLIGTDLRKSHPISIVYDDVADLNLVGKNDPTQPGFGLSGNIPDVLDKFGKVQCSSCHDVHDQETVVGTRLLRKTFEGSQLCLACHLK